ncbi:MAG: PepSY-like domain-containing protein [Saprospiraceae bacterium]|nr:PepSY-like domain-containing protein [Saprospiraceae bacterium]
MVRKLAFLLCLSLACSMQLLAQNTAPQAVVTAFNQMFPAAQDVQWEFDDDQWEAEFALEGEAYEAAFRADGAWVETEREIDPSEVPEQVRTIMIKFDGYEIKEATELRTPDLPLAYELLVRNGQDAVELTVDGRGYVLKMEPATEDEDDGEGGDQ